MKTIINDNSKVIKEGEMTVVMQKGGERVYIRIGNSVIDVMHGYNHSKSEPAAIVHTYGYERSEKKKESHIIVYNENDIVFSR